MTNFAMIFREIYLFVKSVSYETLPGACPGEQLRNVIQAGIRHRGFAPIDIPQSLRIGSTK